jgi:hypothetical protein
MRSALLARRSNLRARRFSMLLAAVPSVLVGLDSACKSPPNVSFSVTLPSALAGEAAWYEVGVFPSGACPNSVELQGGIPPVGPVTRLVFSASDLSPPSLGDLPRASYGFAVVALANTCAVIATGCSIVDVGSADGVSIALRQVAQPAGACESGSTCVDGICVEGSEGGTSSGCSLALVGGGPLADPLVDPVMSMDSTLLSPPAIVATSGGFLIAYREFDVEAGVARLTVLPIDDEGAASSPQQTMLPNRCMGSPESDGAGLAWNGTQGLVALARQTCPASAPGVDLYAVNAEGATTSHGFSPTGTNAVLLSQAHPLASTPAGFLLATVEEHSKVAAVLPVSGVSLGSATPFGGLTQALKALVTGASLGTGLLSFGTPNASTDAGGEGGADASGADDAASCGDSGLPTHTFSLTTLPSSGSLGKLPAASDQSGSWVSLSGVDSRVIVVSNGSGGDPIFWYAFNIGSVAPVASSSFIPNAMGEVLFTDVALHADNAFFAAAVADSIALFAFRKASTYPQLLVENDFADDPRIPIGSISDGLVAVAADNTRVAVVWGTSSTVMTSQDLGGYAVFACSP